jgi:propionate CoA-transferase
MTGGKFDIGVENGRFAIRRDGSFRKFIARVGQISFSAALAAQRGQDVSYVTERAVFQLEHGRVTLTEIAPGVHLEEDVLAHMGFRPHVSPHLKNMDPRIFRPGRWGSTRVSRRCRCVGARPFEGSADGYECKHQPPLKTSHSAPSSTVPRTR